MTEKDIEMVCEVLHGMSEEDVRSLGNAGIWWLPHIPLVPRLVAIGSIRSALREFETMDNRVFCIAWLFLWLTERRHIRVWRSHCIEYCTAALSDRLALHERLASTLAYPGSHTKYVMVERADAVYACIMATQAELESLDHNVICLCIPHLLPYVFVHSTTDEDHLNAVLERVLQSRTEENFCRML
ncbi:hypothetical protein MTO96_029684 [Rhipicephalus appendiculatus]